MLLRKLTRESVWNRVCGVPLTGWWCLQHKAGLLQGRTRRDLAGVQGASAASRATPGPRAALLGGSQWRRQPRRAISPLDAPPDQAGSGLRPFGHWARTQGRGGVGADKAWGSCRRRLGERRPPGFSLHLCDGPCEEAGHGDPAFSMFRAPGRAHLAQLQRADSEECPARGKPRGPLWRAGMPSAA